MGDSGRSMCKNKTTERMYFLKESTTELFKINLSSDYLGTSVNTTSIKLK